MRKQRPHRGRKGLSVIAVILCLSACATVPGPHGMAERPDTRITLDNGQTLAYRAMLNPDTQQQPGILFIHGIPDASDSWLPVMRALAERHPVYAVDLAGYGYSAWPDGHDLSLSAQADYLHEFIARLGLQAVVLVGHDIGGGVAQIMAARYPQDLSRLVLINSAVGRHWPAWEVRLLREPGIGMAGFTVFEDLLWAYLLQKGLHDNRRMTDTVQARYRQWWQGRPGRSRLIRNARALDNGDLADVEADLLRFAKPTLILWGREDRFLPERPARELCTALPHCRFTGIQDAGHFLLDEQPAAVAQHLDAYLSAADAGKTVRRH